MSKRYMTIWFPFLRTDWFTKTRDDVKGMPFVLALPVHGKMIITEANKAAQKKGIFPGMAVADARVFDPSLLVKDDKPGLEQKLLDKLAAYCIRYSPHVAVDLPDGLKLDISGCTHLWGGEKAYLNSIQYRLRSLGYEAIVAIAGTIGAAWAIGRYGKKMKIIETGKEADAILNLPAACLRIENEVVEKLQKLGLYQLSQLMAMPYPAIQRRFGATLVDRLQQALGNEAEWILPVLPGIIWEERLPCLEPISTATGIAIALERLLGKLCSSLKHQEKGLRVAIFKCFRMDGDIQQVQIGTHRPSHHLQHLFKLFEIKLGDIAPGAGIELFVLEAKSVETVSGIQKRLWDTETAMHSNDLSELLDRIAGKVGADKIARYLPAEHYWPERSFKKATGMNEQPATCWKVDKPRPLQLLLLPEPIEVSAPIPDYPPMLFRYRDTVHRITRADGPERIEQEWWLQQGEHRDYYCVEDEAGHRYWLFRSGHYKTNQSSQWFLHGFFA